jgi:ribosomal protein S18 acetylase RimI-like enzyme
MEENVAESIFIRELEPDDLEAFSDIRLHGLIHHPRSFWETAEEFQNKSKEEHFNKMSESFAADDKFILGAFEGAELVGIVGFNRERGTKGRHRGSIWGMYVHSDHQGKGIGTKLLHTAIERTRTITDMEVLFLFVAPENIPAISLYKSCGFTSYGIEPYSMKSGDTYYEEEMMYLKL